MPNVTPAGPLALAINALCALIANTPYFQTWTGTHNATDAGAHVFAGECGISIASYSVAAGIVTVTTRTVHPFKLGDTVTLTGPSIGSDSETDLSGVQTITGVTSNTFTFTLALPDQAAAMPQLCAAWRR